MKVSPGDGLRKTAILIERHVSDAAPEMNENLSDFFETHFRKLVPAVCITFLIFSIISIRETLVKSKKLFILLRKSASLAQPSHSASFFRLNSFHTTHNTLKYHKYTMTYVYMHVSWALQRGICNNLYFESFKC